MRESFKIQKISRSEILQDKTKNWQLGHQSVFLIILRHSEDDQSKTQPM